jgi:hypothetical protein
MVTSIFSFRLAVGFRLRRSRHPPRFLELAADLAFPARPADRPVTVHLFARRQQQRRLGFHRNIHRDRKGDVRFYERVAAVDVERSVAELSRERRMCDPPSLAGWFNGHGALSSPSPCRPSTLVQFRDLLRWCRSG